MNGNGRASAQLNRVDSLRCTTAALQSLDKRTIRGADLGQLVVDIARKFQAYLDEEV
ncbi:MAG: hypothetical protein HYX90_03505 [Chloroflexi bacterium]|nr:hypothetical protein [Chloroflexota bacterium]